MLSGFSDQSHFTRFFKSLIGLTPKQYQNIFKGKEDEYDFQDILAACANTFYLGNNIYFAKILLTDFKPIEILFFRFLIGLFILILIYPKRLRKGSRRKQRVTFALTGLCGVTLYYLLENIALRYSMASNIGVIISIAPFFTAILSHFILKVRH